jgi:hypothetical protein
VIETILNIGSTNLRGLKSDADDSAAIVAPVRCAFRF